MGKKKIEKIRLIESDSVRKVTFCKRKKGLLKKAVELTLLCDLKMFLFIYDPKEQRVVHFASDPTTDFLELFNQPSQREYFSNRDYFRVGGRKDDIDYKDAPEMYDDEQPEATCNEID